MINNSQTTNRRISWIIGLEYRTSSEQLTKIKEEIIKFIEGSDDFTKAKDTLLSVKIDQFAASSIDIRLICYTKTAHYKEWLNAVLSWLVAFNVLNTGNRFVYAILDVSYRLTAPPLNFIRRYMPNLGSIDISPVILILALMFFRNLVFEYLAPSLF